MDPEERQLVNERLRFTWDLYIRLLHLIITLSAGALALSPGLIRLNPPRPYLSSIFVVWGMALLGVSLLCSIVSRVLSQFFLLQEIIGDIGRLENYYTSEDVAPFTATHRIVRGRFRSILIWSLRAATCLAMACFFAGLCCTAVFVCANLQ